MVVDGGRVIIKEANHSLPLGGCGDPQRGLKFCKGLAIGEGGVDPELRGSVSSPAIRSLLL